MRSKLYFYEIQPDDRPERTHGDHTVRPGLSMRDLMSQWSGRLEGQLEDPQDPSHKVTVSIEAWRDRDPDQTFFTAVWEHVDPEKVGRKTPIPDNPVIHVRRRGVEPLE